MSKTLILCVDRDNDFGDKAGVESPVIGREKNLEAANALILADPEDSDANALFSSLVTYDSLVQSGEKVEIGTICGDKNVGPVSDDILVKQLEDVIKITKTDEVIVVSDGAEDEFIIPLIQSRIKIRNIKRVTVRQSPQIESLYYILIKAMSQEKFLKKVFIPVGVAFLVLGLTILFVQILRAYLYGLGTIDPATTGFMTVVSVIGIYLLSKAYSVGKRIYEGSARLMEEFINTRITVFSLLIAIAVFAYGIYIGFRVAFLSAAPVLGLVQLLFRIIPFTIGSIITFDIGRIVEGYFIYRKEKRRETIRLYFLSASFYVSFFVAVLGLLSFINYLSLTGSLKVFYLDLGFTLTGLGVAFGVIVSFARRRYGERVEQPEPEPGTSQKDSRVL